MARAGLRRRGAVPARAGPGWPTLDAERAPDPDADCDGLLDAFDSSDDSLAPRLEVSPREVARAFTGEPVILRAHADGARDVTWSVLDGEGAELASPKARVEGDRH